VDHIAEEVSLLGLAVVADADVGQHFLLEDLLGVLDTPLFGHTRPGASSADEAERYVAVLDDEGLVQRGLDALHHFLVFEVVHNML